MAPTSVTAAPRSSPESRPARPASARGQPATLADVPAELQRRLGNRGLSVAFAQRDGTADGPGVLDAEEPSVTSADAPPAVDESSPADPGTESSASTVPDPARARTVVATETAGLDPGMRAAALSAIADPAVSPAPGAATTSAPASTASRTPVPGDAGPASTPEPGAEGQETLAATDTRGNADGGGDATGADGDAAGGEGGTPAEPGAAETTATAAQSGDGGPGPVGAAAPTGDATGPTVQDTGAGALGTGDLVLIDVELAEHQRWAGALGRVGEVASLRRGEFIAESVGSGFVNGAASGLAMGLAMGVATRFVPAIGPALGGAMALHGLMTRDWDETAATIGKFGEGNDTYETLANSIASVAASIDIVSQVLTVINGIVGVVQVAAAVIAGGAVVAAFFTFGATLGIAAVAADVIGVCEEISLAIGEVTTVLDTLNAAVLQPAVTLFRALHSFTTQADPREVEAQGQGISTAAAASGAALGAWAGGKAAHAGAHQEPPGDDLPPAQHPPHETPPPAAGEGPTVHFQEPAAPVEGGALPAPVAEGIATAPVPAAEVGNAQPVAPVEAVAPAPEVVSAPPVAPVETVAPAPEVVSAPVAPVEAVAPAPEVVSAPVAPVEAVAPAPEVVAAPPGAAAETGPATAPPEQLTLPGTETPAKPPARRPLTPDEVAPPDAHSAYLRQLRAEAEGGPRPAPGRDEFNIARHEIPEKAENPYAKTWESQSPVVDRYQYSPRSPAEHQSHHVEQQAAFEAPKGGLVVPSTGEVIPEGGAVIPGYNAREDVTVMMRQKPEHTATFPAQAEQRSEGNFHQTVGRPQALEEAHNIAVWGTREAPPPGITRPQMMDPAVAGQAVMEHSAYLFETSRISGDIEPTPGVSPRPGETPLANRPTVGELVGPRGGVDPYENIDWGGTFNQPDPYRAAQPVGTQLALPGMEHLAPPTGPAHEQLTLPGLDQPGPNPDQLSLPFDSPAPTPSSPPTSPPPTAAAPPAIAAAQEEASTPVNTTAAITLTSPAAPLPAGASPTVGSATTTSAPAAMGAARPAVPPPATAGLEPGPGTPTLATRAHQVGALFLPQVFGGGAEGPKYAEQRAAHRARFTGDDQPVEGVERVNPAYPPPPATPAQITAIQNQIVNLLNVRAVAEQAAENQADRADSADQNRAPIQQTIADTTAGISAVQAHDAAVARRAAVNQEQQQRQQESAGLVAGYPSRAAGVAALSVPLAAWEGFTSLASHLPGEAGDSMLRMNQEARKMQETFGQMAAQMVGVDSAGPANEQGLQADQGRLESTEQRAQTSDQQLHTASTGALGLQQANEAAHEEAVSRKETATDRAQEAGDAAAERETRADSLAQELRTWARLHAQARQRAIAATAERLKNEGRIVVESSQP